MKLSSGIPKLEQYRELLTSSLYLDLVKESDSFLQKHGDRLTAFRRTWVKDPIRQWSRSWEYPYMWERLIARIKPGSKLMDAGSGLTFFPFALAKQLGCEVHCVDYDARLTEPFRLIAQEENLPVHFHVADMRKMAFETSSFDGVYCVSVLEHTKGYSEILKEFKRVLRPQGELLVSFDICPSGVADIGIEESRKLLAELKPWVGETEALNQPIDAYLKLPKDHLSTLFAKRERPESLPWMFPRLSALKAGLQHGKFAGFIDLTCYCLEGRNNP